MKITSSSDMYGMTHMWVTGTVVRCLTISTVYVCINIEGVAVELLLIQCSHHHTTHRWQWWYRDGDVRVALSGVAMMVVVFSWRCCQLLSCVLVLAVFCGIVRGYFFVCDRSFILFYIELRCSAFAGSQDLDSGKRRDLTLSSPLHSDRIFNRPSPFIHILQSILRGRRREE